MTNTGTRADLDLDAIEARAAAATPGPWGVYESGGVIDIAADLQETGHGYRARRGICRLDEEPMDNDPAHREWTGEEDWAQVQADAAFIAHAPEDVAALVAEVRRLTELLSLAAVLEIPRPDSGLPIQLRRSYGHPDRWAICDGMYGRRWHREHGWVYEAQGIRDEAQRDATRYTLAEAVPLAQQLAAALPSTPA